MHQVNEKLWLYSTRNDNGGATVPTIYRYYLNNRLDGSHAQITAALNENIPFLEGSGTISAISVSADNTVEVTYSGSVLSLDDTASYISDGKETHLRMTFKIN
ncbi:MAG TPA: hypothetical protein VGI71_07270 [Scandinavium sp.]|jgi:hypothetical protein